MTNNNDELEIVNILLENNSKKNELILKFPQFEKEILRTSSIIHSLMHNSVYFGIKNVRTEDKKNIKELYLIYENKDMRYLNDANEFGEKIITTNNDGNVTFESLEKTYNEVIETYNKINSLREEYTGFINWYSIRCKIYWKGFESEDALEDIKIMKHDLSKYKTYESKRGIVTIHMYDKSDWNKKAIDEIASGLPKYIEDKIMEWNKITLYKLKKYENIKVYAISKSPGSMFNVSFYFDDIKILEELDFINSNEFQKS